MTNAELVQTVYKKLPYPNQIEDLDITSSSDAIRFLWRGYNLRVSSTLFVEEVKQNSLASTDLAMVISALLKS